jgi:hypothetical protein
MHVKNRVLILLHEIDHVPDDPTISAVFTVRRKICPARVDDKIHSETAVSNAEDKSVYFCGVMFN